MSALESRMKNLKWFTFGKNFKEKVQVGKRVQTRKLTSLIGQSYPSLPPLESIICFMLLHPALVFSDFPLRSPTPPLLDFFYFYQLLFCANCSVQKCFSKLNPAWFETHSACYDYTTSIDEVVKKFGRELHLYLSVICVTTSNPHCCFWITQWTVFKNGCSLIYQSWGNL